MAEQSVDLRSTLSTLRRHRLVLAVAALVGVVASVCFVLLRPPVYTSTSEVLLPPVKATEGQATPRDVNTEIRIASSDAVFGPAGQALTPPMSLQALERRVRIKAPTTDVLQIVASAPTPERAEAIARAVAKAELEFVTKAASSLSNAELATLQQRQTQLQDNLDTVTAEIKKTQARKDGEDPSSVQGKADAAALASLIAQQASLALEIDELRQKASVSQPDGAASIIQAATPAKRPGLVGRMFGFSLLGLVVAELVAAIVLIVVSRRDRRLRYRDEIADALGSPVVASVRTRVPRSAAGWSSLLEDYAPGTVDAWALRQALHQLVLDRSTSGRAQTTRGQAARGKGGARPRQSLTVVTLSEDDRGLAAAAQLAAYAASSGVRTALVAGLRHESAAPLWAALSQGREIRPGLMVGSHPDDVRGVDLTVVLAVVDRRDPELSGLRDSTVTIVAASAGTATAEELARTAVTADDAGMRITGIVVADPDDLDRTTGRLLQHERAQQVPLPTHLTGVPGGSGPTASNVSGLRRRPR